MGTSRKITQFFKDFRGGVNLSHDNSFTPVSIGINELLFCQNAFDRSGLQKRKGVRKFVASIVTPFPIVGIHRFYRAGISPQLLVAAQDKIYRYDDILQTWDVIKSGLALSLNVTFVTYGPTSKVLIANGLDIPMIYDGTTITNFTAPPAGVKEFVIHRDRIFTYGNNLTIDYSNNLDPLVWSNAPFTLATSDPVITASMLHNQNTADSSVVSQLVFFTANTTWIMVGTDFLTLTDVVLHQISGDIGTLSPKSVVRTPRGVMFVGTQGGRKNVFVIIGEGLGAKVVPIGDKIRQILNGIPLSSLDKLVGIYNDGYYRITFRPSGKTSNTEEWWLRVEDITAKFIAWYGPMIRPVGLRSITTLSGSFDNNQLVAGGEDGFIYQLDTTEDDDGIVIPVDIQTGFHAFGKDTQEKGILSVFFNIQASGGTVTLGTNTDFGDVQTSSKSLTTTGGNFPYTFPFTFPSVSTNLNTLDFTENRKTGIYHSLQVLFSNLKQSFLLNTLGINMRVDEQEKQES